MKICFSTVALLVALSTVIGVTCTLWKADVRNTSWDQSVPADVHNASLLHGVHRRDIQDADGQCKYAISGPYEVIHTADKQFVRKFQIKELPKELHPLHENDLILVSVSDSFELLPVVNYSIIPRIVWKLWTKKCFQERLTETLLFSLSERLEPASRCRFKNVTIRVVKPIPELEPKPTLGIIDVGYGTSHLDSRIVTLLSISVGVCFSLTCSFSYNESIDRFIMHRLDDRHIQIETHVDNVGCNAVYNISAGCSWQDKNSPFMTYSSLNSYVVRFAGIFCSTAKQSKLISTVQLTTRDPIGNQTSTETSLAPNLFTTTIILPSATVHPYDISKQYTGYTTPIYISSSPRARHRSTKSTITVQSVQFVTSRTVPVTTSNLSEIRLTPTHLKESDKTTGITESSVTTDTIGTQVVHREAASSHETGSNETTLARERISTHETSEPSTILSTPILHFNTSIDPPTLGIHKSTLPKATRTQHKVTVEDLLGKPSRITKQNTRYTTQRFISDTPRVRHRSTQSTITVQSARTTTSRTVSASQSSLSIIIRTTYLKESAEKKCTTERSVTTDKTLTQFVHNDMASSHETGSVETTLAGEKISTHVTGEPTRTLHMPMPYFSTSIAPPTFDSRKLTSLNVIRHQRETTVEDSFEKSTKFTVIITVVSAILGVPLLVGLYYLKRKKCNTS